MPKMEQAGGAPPPATVLLVEDDPRIASFLSKGFLREGFRFEWISTGREALVRLDEGGIDVLLLDLGLPDVDGLEVLREARERGLDLPVIIVTGRSDPRDRVVALSLAVMAYLTKPFPWADLLAKVRAAVDQATSPRTGDALGRPDQG